MSSALSSTPVPALPVTPLTGSVGERLGLAVAPSTGRFRPAATAAPDAEVDAGTLLGHVTGGRGRADEVRTAARGRIRSLLVRPGQLVGTGSPLVWLEYSS
jgi:biotin carboxyl carrier protein